MPAIPHPTPKSAAPSTSLLSTRVLVGNECLSSKMGLFPAARNLAPTNDNGRAPANTPIIEASQFVARKSRNPSVFAGCIILDSASPVPNNAPRPIAPSTGGLMAKSAINNQGVPDCRSSNGDSGIPIDEFSIDAVAAPVDMNVTTATRLRRESRASPHTPCPEVQPLPSEAPVPRINVPMARRAGCIMASTSTGTGFADECDISLPLANKPRRNSKESLECVDIDLDSSPLTPVTRPLRTKFQSAESPIQVPPSSEGKTSNCMLMLVPWGLGAKSAVVGCVTI